MFVPTNVFSSYLPTLVSIPAGPAWRFDRSSGLSQPIPVDEFLIGKQTVSNEQFGYYQDAMQENETPYALFGRNTQTGWTELLVRLRESQVKEKRTVYTFQGDESEEERHFNITILTTSDFELIEATGRYEKLRVSRIIDLEKKFLDFRDNKKRFGGDFQPVVIASWFMATSYAEWAVEQMVKSGLLTTGYRGRLPSTEEYTRTAQGPRVPLLKVMREEHVPLDRFAVWVKDRYGHFEVEGKPRSTAQVQQRLLQRPSLWDRLMGRSFDDNFVIGSRIYSSPSGRLTPEAIWYGHHYESGFTPNVDWGPETGYGTQQMSGAVHEFLRNIGTNHYYKGSSDHAKCRAGHWESKPHSPGLPIDYYIDHDLDCSGRAGFRVAASREMV